MTLKPTSDAVAVTGAGTFERIVSHDEALEAAKALIDGHFNNKGGRGVYISIPAQPDNTDVLLVDYIKQQRALSRLASTHPMTEGESGERCHDCGGFYATVYRVPDDVWAKIAPDKAALGEHEEHRYGGLLCLPCADRRAREKGIRLYFDASVGDWRPMTEDVAGLVEDFTSALRLGVEDDVTIPFDLAVRIHAALTTPAPAVKPHCSTCGKDVAEVLCETCGKWWDAALLADICDNMAEVLKPLPGEE